MSRLNFHPRHEVTPERAWEVLTAINTGADFSQVIQADRQLKRLQDLGLIKSRAGEHQPTADGQALCEAVTRKPEIVFELFHYLHYIQWDAAQPLKKTLFWSYRTCCQLLYERQQCTLDTTFKKQMADEMNTMISNSEMFGPHVEASTRKGAVSISHNTISGVQHWLAALNPIVIEDNIFTRRTFCPPELMVLAVGELYREAEVELGTEMLLLDDKLNAICQLCLLDPQVLTRSLDWMVPLYPQLVQPGTRTGSYGRSIRLLEMPTLNEVVV